MALSFKENPRPAGLQATTNPRALLTAVGLSANTIRDLLGLPTTSVDEAIVRFDGTSGHFQGTTITVDDNDVVTGAHVLATSTTTARSLENRFREVFNVKDYGAVGDGSTDDTTAIQAAVTAAGALATTVFGSIQAGAGRVYLPSGRYLITSRISCSNPVAITGDGRNNSLIEVNTASGGILLTADNPTDAWVIADIGFRSKRANAGPCITVNGSSTSSSNFPGLQIKSVHIWQDAGSGHYFTKGLDIDNVWHYILDDVFILGATAQANWMTAGIDIGTKSIDGRITNCYVYGAQIGLDVSATDAEGVIIDHCSFLACEQGVVSNNVSTATLDLSVTDCHIAAATCCIDATGPVSTFISGNLLYLGVGGVTTANGSINVNIDDTNRTIIVGNIIENTSAATGTIGIKFTDSSLFTVDRNLLAGFSIGINPTASASTGSIGQNVFTSVSTPVSNAGTNVTVWDDGAGAMDGVTTLNMGANVTAQKLWTYRSGNNRYGFGLQANEGRWFVPSDSHASIGTISVADGSTWAEKLRVNNDGAMTFFGSANTIDMADNVSDIKVQVYHSGNTRYGLGVNSGGAMRIFSPSTQQISFGTISTADGSTFTENLRLNTDGSVIMTGSSSILVGGTATSSSLSLKSTTGVGATDFVRVLVGNNGATEASRWDTSGNNLIGATAAQTIASVTPIHQIHGLTAAAAQSMSRWSNDASAAILFQAKSRGTSIGSHSAVQANDVLGNNLFYGSDGTGFIQAARIRALVDGTVGTNDMPTRMEIGVTADGASAVTNRLIIFNDGGARFGSTTTSPGAGVVFVDVLARTAPVTETGTTHTVAASTTHLICNQAGTVTVTLPTASSFTGREIYIKTITANTVVSASSNVVPSTSATAGTAILPATDGAWALLVSDGTNWIIMAANPLV